jgi:general secretion pathway protein B
MSYILDALRKADAERAREAAGVPDLYAQGDGAAEGARTSSHGSKWLLLALLAVLLAGLVWVWLGAARVEPVRPAEPDRSPAPVAAPAPTPVPPMPHAVDTPAVAPPPMLPQPQPQPQPAALLPQTAAAVTAPPHVSTAAAPSSTRAPKPTVGASAASQAPPAVTLAELPADLRAQLPVLTVGGSVYSPAAASRIVILNGQVFREGDQPAEGLTVVQIGLKSSVLMFRGVRFELKH